MIRVLADSLEGGAAALLALAFGRRPPRLVSRAREWTIPRDLLATFRTPASARLALRLVGAFDPQARLEGRAAIAARVPFGVAAAAVVVVGLDELLALGAAPPASRGRGHVRVSR